jgi:hypothetical protein
MVDTKQVVGPQNAGWRIVKIYENSASMSKNVNHISIYTWFSVIRLDIYLISLDDSLCKCWTKVSLFFVTKKFHNLTYDTLLSSAKAIPLPGELPK